MLNSDDTSMQVLDTALTLPKKQYLSVEEAQKLLPQIEEHLLEIRKVREALKILSSVELQFDDAYLAHAKEIRYAKEIAKLTLAVHTHLDAIDSLGCFVMDVDQGLIDFFSKKAGQEIFLCWKLGEGKIQHWHETNKGFSERRGIEEL